MTVRNYIIYNKDTGEIVRSGACQARMVLKQQRGGGESIMLGNIPDNLQVSKQIKIINGKPCIVNKAAVVNKLPVVSKAAVDISADVSTSV
jgi:hypothetical protein